MKLLIIAMLLPGCATSAGYEKMLRTWGGKSGSELVSGWGVPNKTINLADGQRGYEYISTSASGSPCRTTFISDAKEDKITSASFEGMCLAR